LTTSNEIAVALRSSRVRTTVPSRINRTIGSSASERAFHASQSLFTLRQVRLTGSLPTPPPNNAVRARRTRRVLVSARYTLAISASAASVRRWYARNAWLFHSVVLPAGVFIRARGTSISIGPKVPVSDRVRLPWR